MSAKLRMLPDMRTLLPLRFSVVICTGGSAPFFTAVSDPAKLAIQDWFEDDSKCIEGLARLWP